MPDTSRPRSDEIHHAMTESKPERPTITQWCIIEIPHHPLPPICQGCGSQEFTTRGPESRGGTPNPDPDFLPFPDISPTIRAYNHADPEQPLVDITLDFLSVDPPAMRFKLHGNIEPDNIDHPGVQGVLFRLSCRECGKEADFEIRFEPGRGTCFYWHTDMQVFITESHARSLDMRRQLEAERNDPDAVPSNVARKLAALAKKYNLKPIQTQAISQAVLDIKRKMLANPRNIIPREDLKSFGHDVTQLANELGISGEDLDELGDAIVKGLQRI